MSEEPERDRENNEQKKKTRRTRKDEEGRNFTCPCGKSYLSYPALYTHIKTKHHGKTPKQTPTPTPKPPQQHPATTCPLTLIKQHVQKYFPNDDASTYSCPLNPTSLDYINTITQLEEESKEQRNQGAECINGIFGRFLAEMRRIGVKGEAYVYLCDLICCFEQSIEDDKKDPDFCRNNDGALLPHYFNDLIVHKKVPNTIQPNPDDNSNYLKLACRVLLNFGVWLFEQKYTSYAVKFNIV